MPLNKLYSKKVMDHFQNPHNMGVLKNPSGVGRVGNPVCGDLMELQIKVEKDKITDAKFQTFGCGAAIATSSIMTDMIIGKSLKEAQKVSNNSIVEALNGLPPVKKHCSLLAEEALQKAIENYKKNNTTIDGRK